MSNGILEIDKTPHLVWYDDSMVFIPVPESCKHSFTMLHEWVCVCVFFL